jgi:hypothetical protein
MRKALRHEKERQEFQDQEAPNVRFQEAQFDQSRA